MQEAIGKIANDKLPMLNDKKSFQDYGNVIKENKVEKNKFKINYLSYSQIETFEVCPLHYKLRYILKIPTQPTAALSFGISMHDTLKDLYEARDSKLANKLLRKNWIKEGYVSREHADEFFVKGKIFLKEYLEIYPFGNSKVISLEEPFTVLISNNLKIGGKIDRIDLLAKASDKSSKFEIWDYKTGANVPTQKEVDKNLQLTIYAMAAVEKFKIKPDAIKLSLYYFETQTKISTTRTVGDLIKAKEEILKVRDEIEKSNFECSGGFLCQNCEFKLFCKAEE